MHKSGSPKLLCAVGLLAATMVSLLFPAIERSLAADAASARSGPERPVFGDEVNGLRAGIALAKEQFVIGEPIEVAFAVQNVSPNDQIVWHSGFWPNHLVQVHDAEGAEAPLNWTGTRQRAAFSPGGERGKNAPVAIAPGGEDAAYERYDLTKLYNLTRPGKYTVQYVYQEEQAGGWQGRLPSNAVAFELVATPPRAEGTVEHDGVQLEILVPQRKWPIPTREPGARTPVNLGLRITNRTRQPLRFTRFDTLRVELQGPDGTWLRLDGGRDGTLGSVASDHPLLPPGEGVTFIIDAALSWRGDELQLGGSDGFGGVWLFHNLAAGKYHVRIRYRADDDRYQTPALQEKAYWTHQVETPLVKVALVEPAAAEPLGEADDGLSQSKPVRVEGLEFVALAPARIQAPPPGGEREVDLGLRVTNVSDKPLALYITDVVRASVFNTVDRTRLEMELGQRLRTALTALARLDPGESWTWRPEATLNWTTDRATLRLSGPDGRSVAGPWSITTLKVGQHRLSVEYANGRAELDGVPLWVGTAETEEAQFEIVR